MLSNHKIKIFNSWTVDIFLLASFILILYACWLGSYPLFTPDEGRYSEAAREMLASGDYITPHVNGIVFLDKPILYYWLQAAAIRLFGIQEWALRFFPMLLGTLGCLMTYICGRQLFNRRAGLMSALILASSPLYFSGAHYANLDLETAVWIGCALLCFITAAHKKDKLRPIFLLGFYFFAACAFLTKGLIGIVFPALIPAAWMLLQKRLYLLKQIHLLKGTLLFILIAAPWYFLVQKANPEFFHYFFMTQQVSRFLSTQTFNNATTSWFYVPVILVGFFPWICFLPQTLSSCLHTNQDSDKKIYLILWIGIITLFFSIPHSKIITYILPVFPPLALLAGDYLSRSQTTARLAWGFFFLNSAFAFLFLAVPYFHWLKLPDTFNSYLYLMAFIYFLSAMISLLFCKKKNLVYIFLLALCANVLVLLTLTFGASYLNQRSTKPLVEHLTKILQPTDEVVHYFKFFQDVPLYLGKEVIIAADWDSPAIADNDNWAREFWYGKIFHDTGNKLINEKTFWEKWNSSNRVFVFLGKNYFDRFKAHAGHYYLEGEINDILLVSNRSEFLRTKK